MKLLLQRSTFERLGKLSVPKLRPVALRRAYRLVSGSCIVVPSMQVPTRIVALVGRSLVYLDGLGSIT